MPESGDIIVFLDDLAMDKGTLEVIYFFLLISAALIIGLFWIRRDFKDSFLGNVILAFSALTGEMSLFTFYAGKFDFIHVWWVIPLVFFQLYLVAKYTFKYIHVPLYRMTKRLDQISKGDLNVNFREIHVRTENDEIGHMKNSLRQVLESLQNINHFASQIGSGNFDFNYNKLGENDQLGGSLLLMRDNLESVLTDINLALTNASEKGQLKTYIDVEQRSGMWKEISQGVNHLLESFSKPLSELNRIITAMSSGDLTQRYEIEATGDVHEMATHLNSALKQLDILLFKIAEGAKVFDESSEEIKISTQEMTASTQEISLSIGEMSNGSQLQMQKVDESSALVEDIRNATAVMKDRAEEIQEAAILSSDTCQNGLTLIQAMEERMTQLSHLSQNAEDSIKDLTEKSRKIDAVLKVLAEVATQTNMLALNAAIEAAQAGESGRGFAIVAEEIRKLAENSRSSAEEIGQLIESVQTTTRDTANAILMMNEGVTESASTSSNTIETFQKILETTARTRELSQGIVNSTEAQVNSVSEIASVTENIVVVAEQTAAGTEEVAASAEELSSGMRNANDKMIELAKVSESIKDGLSMVTFSGEGAESSRIFNMKAAYEREKSLLDALLNNSPDAIYFKDMESRFIRCSQSVAELAGQASEEQVIGKTDFDFYPEKEAQFAFEGEQEIIKQNRTSKDVVTKNHYADGTYKWISNTKMPLYDLNKKVMGTIGISRDISDLKEAELEAKQQLQNFQNLKEEYQKNVDKIEALKKENEELRKKLEGSGSSD